MNKLQETYKETDRVVQESLANDNRETACHKGCSNCCQSIGFPILEPEVHAIAAHVQNIANEQLQQRIFNQMEDYENEGPCPFLIDTECGIYATRPLACRTFYIHGEPCTTEEIEDGTRTNDIHRIDSEGLFDATVPLLEMYQIPPSLQAMAFHGGFIQERSMPMNQINWSGIAEVIKKHK